ncbi:hypothetical protein BCR43DRAFT_506903 [Syncephalastrum racemosum]|uniref:Threonine/serine exporter-like N-terminal domain-containing protein n=1 Tax=Syncephalastrum racemosum TaxID=13706 RepID=A0A1X2HA80_SYNRA|nr:hypothetical protein BCR43DRAFT_506903 [Syncephalastrum racemosum]
MAKLDLQAQFGYFPGFLLVSFGPENTLSTAQLVKVAPGLDLHNLLCLFELMEEVLTDQLTLAEATVKLDHIQHQSLYPTWLRLVAYGAASSTSAPLFFNGGWIDMALGFFLGVVLAAGVHVSPILTRFTSIFDVLMASVVGFLAAAVAARLPSSCFYALSIGGVVSLLPGYATLVSVLELASGAVASGTLQLATTLVYSLLLGFGLAIGASTHQLLFSSLAIVQSDAMCHALPWYYDFIWVPGFTAANVVILKAPARKYPILLLLAALSHCVHSLCFDHFVAYPHIATVAAAFAVATAAHIHCRIAVTVGFVDMIMGLLFLVPGSVGVSSSLDTFGQVLTSSSKMTETSVILNAGQQGIVFSSHMMVIAVSVSVGLVLATVVLFPVRKLVDALLKTPPPMNGKGRLYKKKDWLGDITF